MKYKFFSDLAAASLLFCIFCIVSCKKEAEPASEPLSISIDKSSVRANNFDEVTITVKEYDTDVTSSSTIFIDGPSQPPFVIINGDVHITSKFYTVVPGTYTIKATKDGRETKTVTVTATDPGASPFSQKILVEDYTATWCGYSPRVGVALKNYSATNPRCIMVGVHGPLGTSDPYIYQGVTPLINSFNIQIYPTAIVNRDFEWDEYNSSLGYELTKRAPLGIALETTINGVTINVKAKVKFDGSSNFPLKIIILLVEDGLIFPQRNFYAPEYGADPISNYVHTNTLRAAATDIFGDDIPVASQRVGSTWEKNVSINATGYKMSNCKIVAAVVYAPNTFGRSGSLNAQSVNAGQNKNFD